MFHADVSLSALVFNVALQEGTRSAMAIGAQTSWHMKPITDGETCVESYINKKERQRLSRLGYKFRNPFDLTPRQNWLHFLGFNQSDRGWRHILLPSTFPPNGDGLTWRMNAAAAAAAAAGRVPSSSGFSFLPSPSSLQPSSHLPTSTRAVTE